MSERYANPPLVELVAELQWHDTHRSLFTASPPGHPVQVTPDVVSAAQGFYDRFASEVEHLGFLRSERLMPIGEPGFPGQATIRFRRKAGEAPLLQLGPGVFTANGLPPAYGNWDDFRPVLEGGVQALLATRVPDEQLTPFSSLSLRYIDAFGSDYWRGESATAFIARSLGFGLSVPESISSSSVGGLPQSQTLALRFALESGGWLNVSVGDGSVNGLDSVIVDTLVGFEGVPADQAAVMQAFERAHDVTSSIFGDITSSIRDILGPIGSE